MQTFLSFISEAAIKSKGIDAERHASQYITPYLPGNEKHAPGTHEVLRDHEGLSAGDKVTIHGHEVDDNGVHHAIVSKVGSRKKIRIPVNKLNKPIKAKNRGLENEGNLVGHLNKHGLMEGGGAGFTSGNDFHLVDKRGGKKKKIRGTQGQQGEIEGEHKSDIKTTAFGQITMERHPKTGKWRISDETRAKHPELAAQVESKTFVGLDGKKRKLIDHMNHSQPVGYQPKKGNTRANNEFSEEGDLSPAHAYMRDHGVDVLHIDSHGTFAAGHSETTDRQKLGLPKMEGTSRLRVRQKTSDPNKRTIQVEIRSLKKSTIHIGTDEGAEEMKKRLGHS